MTERVYFAAAAGRIKIGTTSRGVTVRLVSINSHLAEPLVLLGDIEGGVPLERAIQKHLRQFKIKGEWYRDCDEIRRSITNIIRCGPSIVGYAGPLTTRASIEARPRLPRDPPLELGDLVRIIWPIETIVHLASFSEESADICRGWIDGTIMPPKFLRAALAMRMWPVICGDDDDPDTESARTAIFVEVTEKRRRQASARREASASLRPWQRRRCSMRSLNEGRRR